MRRRAGASLRCRGTDRVEDVIAALLTVIAAAGLLFAFSAGSSAHADAGERGHAEAMTRLQTDAILTEDAPTVVMMDGPGAAHAVLTAGAATWSAPDGTLRTGQVPVTSGARKGEIRPIWIDRDGALADAPTSAAVAVLAAVITGAEILLLTAAVIAGAWLGTRRVTALVNSRAWEREWAAIEPQWRRNPR